MPLDVGAASIHFLPEGDWLAAVNEANDRFGDVTVWPAGEVDRTQALRFTDYLLTSDLDRAETP